MEKYETPEMEIIELDNVDIITSSTITCPTETPIISG